MERQYRPAVGTALVELPVSYTPGTPSRHKIKVHNEKTPEAPERRVGQGSLRKPAVKMTFTERLKRSLFPSWQRRNEDEVALLPHEPANAGCSPQYEGRGNSSTHEPRPTSPTSPATRRRPTNDAYGQSLFAPSRPSRTSSSRKQTKSNNNTYEWRQIAQSHDACCNGQHTHYDLYTQLSTPLIVGGNDDDDEMRDHLGSESASKIIQSTVFTPVPIPRRLPPPPPSREATVTPPHPYPHYSAPAFASRPSISYLQDALYDQQEVAMQKMDDSRLQKLAHSLLSEEAELKAQQPRRRKKRASAVLRNAFDSAATALPVSSTATKLWKGRKARKAKSIENRSVELYLASPERPRPTSYPSAPRSAAAGRLLHPQQHAANANADADACSTDDEVTDTSCYRVWVRTPNRAPKVPPTGWNTPKQLSREVMLFSQRLEHVVKAAKQKDMHSRPKEATTVPPEETANPANPFGDQTDKMCNHARKMANIAAFALRQKVYDIYNLEITKLQQQHHKVPPMPKHNRLGQRQGKIPVSTNGISNSTNDYSNIKPRIDTGLGQRRIPVRKEAFAIPVGRMPVNPRKFAMGNRKSNAFKYTINV